jgi:hypothetical protein
LGALCAFGFQALCHELMHRNNSWLPRPARMVLGLLASGW